jgi:putative SOS response-associated peptidase YedK
MKPNGLAEPVCEAGTGPQWGSCQLKDGGEKRGRHSQLRCMCGRYASYLPPEFIARLFGTVNPLPNLKPTWNLAPTDDAPVVRRAANGDRHLDVLKWGLVPYFTKDLKKPRKPINARSETVATSGMFKAAFAKRRCLVPAPVYYEWRDDPEGKTPFAVARADGGPVVFAGIWEDWPPPDGKELHTFSTITTEANRQLAALQDRMPVILEKADWPLWLGEVEGDVPALLRPLPEDVLRVWPVDKRVGNVRSDGARADRASGCHAGNSVASATS